jgi:hypothetical protein
MDPSIENTTASPQQEPAPKSAEYNWREMREAQRRLSDENQQLKTKLDQLAQAQVAASQPKAPEINYAPDDLIDYRTAQALAEQRAKQIVDTQMGQMAQMQRVQYAELALKQQFPDIEKVLLDRDVQERVAREEPEFWEASQMIPDPYRKGTAMYKLMKKYIVDPDTTAAKEQMAKNMAKPIPGPGMQRNSPIAQGLISPTKLTQNQAKQNMLSALQGWQR